MARNRNEKNRGRTPSPGVEKPEIGPIHLSTLRRSDLTRVLEIEKTCFSHPWSRESFVEVLSSKTFSTLSAQTPRGELVGYIVYSEVADELHILNVAILPSYRRAHIATMMMAHLHTTAVQHGRRYAYLEVRETNLAAQKLYAKFGFRPLGKQRDFYSDTHEDAILMGATLTKSKR